MSARNVLSTTIFCIKKITFDFSEKIKKTFERQTFWWEMGAKFERDGS